MNVFDEINKEAERIERINRIEAPISEKELENQISSFQIRRVNKYKNEETFRYQTDCLNIIQVTYGEVDIAKHKAIRQAEKLGNCFVIAIYEECIFTIKESVSPKVEVYKSGRKILYRNKR